MKHDSIEDILMGFDNCEVEEIDLTESAMYKRAFKKFYFKEDEQINEDNDCQDIEEEDEEEIDEEELEIEDKDIEIEEEDLQWVLKII